MRSAFPRQAEVIRKHRYWFIAYGAILALLGLLAVSVPGIATLAVDIMVGWLLIVGGISGLITIIRAGSSESGFWWNLITAIVFILAGVSLLWQPLTGILTLTIILAAYLIASGLSKIAASFGYRRDVGRGWGWMLFSALVDLALGIIIVLGLPGVAGWVLGLLVGINLFFTGVALIMLALGAGAMTKTDGDAGAVPSS